jgi:long-chain fatty acid transport protein
MNLPATASLGLDYKFTPAFSVQAEVARSTWSRFKELRVKFDTGAPDSVTNESWNDTTFVSIGANWKLNDAWTIRYGIAMDQSAVDDAHRTPRIPDNDRKWISLGASYQYSKKATVDIGFTRIFVADGKVMLTAAGDNVTRGSLNGVMAAAINILGAQLRYSF